MTRYGAGYGTEQAPRVVSEGQRRSAYCQALADFAPTPPAAPTSAPSLDQAPQEAARPAAPAAAAAPVGRSAKHALLHRLHARSNSGMVFLRDVGKVFDELLDAPRAVRD
ncbi:hypothetical protein [Roseivivax sp. CAU 1761]